MLESISGLSRTIEEFRDFANHDHEMVEFKVVQAAEKAVSLVQGTLNAQQVQAAVVAACDPMVHGYPNQFSQVLCNIIINARDAFASQKVTSPFITIEIAGEKDSCIITITDNAGGIPNEIIDKIFDPYFTTKGPQQGLGISLYMSKIIIEKKMGGSLSARNVSGGAQFRIEMPRTSAEERDAPR
jgi:C4-dicarboxylate-specific signal transduction histidine kinase